MFGMMKDIQTRFSIFIELFSFFWKRKLWWIVPLLFILFIMMSVVLFGQSTGVAPFLYPLF